MTGAAFAVLVLVVRDRSFENYVARRGRMAEYVFPLLDVDPDSAVSAARGLSYVVSLGALFGAGCGVAARVLPVPPVAAGAAFGATSGAAFVIGVDQLARRRGSPRLQLGKLTATVAAYGAAVGWVIGRGGER
jgi:hypothetical protein